MIPIVIIPSRLQAIRLPGKPLLEIGDKPMIVHVYEKARQADIGRVVVACCGEEIASAIRSVGGEAVLTDPALPSGTDRVYAALLQVDPEGHFDVAINLQGDLPFINPTALKQTLLPLKTKDAFDISTIAAKIENPEEISNPNVVKIALGSPQDNDLSVFPALYFSRQSIVGSGNIYYHHIGVYGFKREALKRFVSLPSSGLEKAERLEQLRALEAGMKIGVALIEDTPMSIDHSEDLEKARTHLYKINF